jgi:DNA mismatch repair protein MutS2
MEISNRTAQMLEWPDFLQFYSAYVSSPAGRNRMAQIVPVADLTSELQLSREILDCAKKGILPGFESLENISSMLEKAAIPNQILDGINLFHIGRLAALNNEIRTQASGWKTEYPQLYHLCDKLPDLKEIEKQLTSAIEPTGEVKEDATPELARIRKQILHLKDRVEKALEKYLRDPRYQDALQEEYVTYRHGRAVLLLRTDHKSVIRGVVHGESGSGASLFVEPLPVLELNNDLAQLTDRHQEEILRLLRELTASVGSQSHQFLTSLDSLVHLDLLFARGRFGRALDCIVPEITEEFHIVLRNGRHPLLQSALARQNKQMIPISFELVPEKQALVVTGPNTGGKTVFLKTAGLLSLMTHCAIPIPASEGTTLPQFSAIEADIGDQQSISENLSTFSSHITNVASIFSKLKERSLILMDELGTGTDPEEGASLAVAILEELLKHNIKTLVTSHHTPVKLFAFNHSSCLSAAMEFDEKTLEPTYHVLMDQTGASRAFEIASKLGLPNSILLSARKVSGSQLKEMQEFQKRLQERIEILTKTQSDLETQKSVWEAKAREQKQKLDSLQDRLNLQRRELKEKNTDLLRTLTAEVESLMANIREASIKQELRKQWKEQVQPITEQLEALTPVVHEDQEFQIGERVWVTLYRDFGELLSLKKGQAELLIRNKRFTVPVTMLEKKEPIAQSLPKGVQMNVPEKLVERELNLIGQTVEEALDLVDKYLDDAVLSQLPEVRLIHGHGTGRLKKAVEEMLSGHPHVKRFHPEARERGGSGVTVVELKQI